MSLIETQSKTTIGDWCVDYAEKYILNIYEKAFPEDDRLRLAVEAYRSYRKGELKLPELKKAAALTVQAAKEAEKNPGGGQDHRTGHRRGVHAHPFSGPGFLRGGSHRIRPRRPGRKTGGIRSDRRTGMRKDGRSAACLYGGE